ncbi:MAG: tRNA (adenosine(37)-N6)-threonylcarbamoyltransferase complex transferase subunit TsaD [Bacteroidota bacterium]|nr:tRNA (adenosine(37)-N6)-threonylcarbamoyltransferase complex transferase subunit TsaD [Bacteroidota bacterium]
MSDDSIFLLAIESSCDDTAAAVLRNDVVLSNVVSSQEVHQKYGGVVPELASRTHEKNIIPVVEQALKDAGIDKQQLSAIAFTQGPGLLGSLLVGGSFAKSLSLALNIPLIGVNHLQGHILAHFINHDGQPKPSFPFLAITISGGHTQIIQVNAPFEMEILGETLDDAVGEAFDKSAKILGLPYPGGVLIDKYAQLGKPIYSFSKPKIADLNFSFSGLKTQILYFVQNKTKENPDFVKDNLYDICASIQHIITQIIIDKIEKAVQQTHIKQIALGGGVSANTGIRTALAQKAQKLGWKVFIPKFEYTTDNAAMIGIVGYLKYKQKQFDSINTPIKARF